MVRYNLEEEQTSHEIDTSAEVSSF